MSFFTVSSIIMLVGVLVGFAPSFFLRPWYFDTQLPLYLTIHGVAMTAWFAVMPVQAYLAESRRLRWHRPLGWTSLGIAALLVVSAIPVLTHSVPKGLSAGLPAFAVSFVFMVGVLRLVFFTALVGIAVRWRRHRAIHARALFLASLSSVAPATTRIVPAVGLNVVLIALVYLVPFGIALMRHDRHTSRRVHALTAYGFAALFLIVLIPVGLVLGGVSRVIVAYVH